MVVVVLLGSILISGVPPSPLLRIPTPVFPRARGTPLIAPVPSASGLCEPLSLLTHGGQGDDARQGHYYHHEYRRCSSHNDLISPLRAFSNTSADYRVPAPWVQDEFSAPQHLVYEPCAISIVEHMGVNANQVGVLFARGSGPFLRSPLYVSGDTGVRRLGWYIGLPGWQMATCLS